MWLYDLLQKNKMLVFWNRCRIHAGDPEFRDMVLNGYHSCTWTKDEGKGNEYPGQTVYLVKTQGGGVGFFADLGANLIKLYYADERGYVPYILWDQNSLYYEADGVDGVQNAYEYYFDQASDVTDPNKASHLIVTKPWHYEEVKKKFQAVSYDVSDEYVNAMADMMKKYVSFNDKTQSYLEGEIEKLLGARRTLGIHFRGTDFNQRYNNHPVPVTLDQMIDKAREMVKTYHYEQIFLATDEQSAVDRFHQEFGSMVKTYQDTYRSQGGNESIAFSEADRDHHHYLLGLEVVRDQYTLTCCESLLCGYSNVTFLARIMRRAWFDHDFEHYILINNGLNHNDNSFSASGHGAVNAGK